MALSPLGTSSWGQAAQPAVCLHLEQGTPEKTSIGSFLLDPSSTSYNHGYKIPYAGSGHTRMSAFLTNHHIDIGAQHPISTTEHALLHNHRIPYLLQAEGRFNACIILSTWSCAGLLAEPCKKPCDVASGPSGIVGCSFRVNMDISKKHFRATRHSSNSDQVPQAQSRPMQN